MEILLGHLELFIISQVSTVEGCPLCGVPLHSTSTQIKCSCVVFRRKFFDLVDFMGQSKATNIKFYCHKILGNGMVQNLWNFISA